MKTSWKAKKKWMHRVLRDLPTDSLSPLVQAENARTLARVSTLLSRGYTLTGSHGKAVHRRADALELYEEAGDRYAQTRHYEDAARMYRVVGLEDKANAVERTGEASLRQLRRDVLGTSTLVLLGGFMLLGLLVLFPSPLGNVIAPLSSSRFSFFVFACSIFVLVFGWLKRRTLVIWWHGFTAIFK